MTDSKRPWMQPDKRNLAWTPVFCFERICRLWKAPSKSKWLVQNTVAKHPRAWAVILTAKIFPRPQYQTVYVFCLKPRIPVALDLLIWVLRTETNICSQQKGLRVLNCHGCINASQREHMQRLKSESESKRQKERRKQTIAKTQMAVLGIDASSARVLRTASSFQDIPISPLLPLHCSLTVQMLRLAATHKIIIFIHSAFSWNTLSHLVWYLWKDTG